jgi:hypothetical protein
MERSPEQAYEDESHKLKRNADAGYPSCNEVGRGLPPRVTFDDYGRISISA